MTIIKNIIGYTVVVIAILFAGVMTHWYHQFITDIEMMSKQEPHNYTAGRMIPEQGE